MADKLNHNSLKTLQFDKLIQVFQLFQDNDKVNLPYCNWLYFEQYQDLIHLE